MKVAVPLTAERFVRAHLGSARASRTLHALSLAALMMLPQFGCDDRETPHQASAPQQLKEDFLKPYPPGTWRLARQELQNVFLTVSHILVVHDGSRSGDQSPLRTPYWEAERAVRRTRDEARSLATSIAKEARSDPTQFAALARRYSDDLPTHERGGSLGTWSASGMPPEFLDALATMRPGDVSRVVETALGFHVLHLRPPPAESRVAARRIVIRYKTTAPVTPRSEAPIERTRAEAESLAKAVAREAAENPQRFGELVEKYSDDADVLRGGDFGLWSTFEVSARAREIEALSALAVGAISEPIDGHDGFSIFMRTEAVERPQVAATYLQVKVEPSKARLPASSKSVVATLPADVRAMLRKRGEGFEALQAKYCCAVTEQWSLGRGIPRAEQIVSSLEPGGVSTTPYPSGRNRFRFYKRLAPAAGSAKAKVATELPRPQAPDVDAIVASVPSGAAIAKTIAGLRAKLGDGFGTAIDDDKKQRFARVIEQLEEKMRTQPPEQRLALLSDARRQLRDILGARAYADMQANVRSEVTRQLMGPR